MKFVLRLLALGALLGLPFAAPASAQYMYLDTNGDAVHTSADVMNPNGIATTADVYLITNQNRDGSVAVCNNGPEELTINSYIVNLSATGGTVNYNSFTNAQASFNVEVQPKLNDETEMTVGYAAGTVFPPGKYKLGTVTITGVTGAASINFIPITDLGPNPTSFGTACNGTEFLNTYTLALDWTDADGLTSAAGGNQSPSLQAAGTINATEGAEITPITVTATDADASDVLTITATGVPNGLVVTTTPGTSPNTATLSGTPAFDAQGSHTITWSVSDGTNPPITATTTVEIANTDRAPIVSAPITITANPNVELTIPVTATDLDGEAIVVLSASVLPAGATFTANDNNTAGTLTWTPSTDQFGAHSITFTATNSLSGTAVTEINVVPAGGDVPPTLDAIADVTLAEGGTLTINVHAADQDSDLVVVSVSGLPGFGTLNPPTSGTADVSTTITLSPGTGDLGVYTVTVSATANDVTTTETFVINVTGVGGEEHAPTITAPANVSGAENVALTFTVTAFDADGDAITSLTASPLPAGATFTANVTNTLGTFSWTPSGTQAGTYDVTFTASNDSSATAVTHITISESGSTDQAPVVNAPASVTGKETCRFSFTVTASDPDGDAISSLTASPLPAGATFTTNTANTSGTFRWDPTLTQAGEYDVTFTAANAMTGSDMTHITIRDRDMTLDIAAIANITVAEGSTITVNISAVDTDIADLIRLTACLPGFATLNAPLTATGSIATTLTITPPLGTAGTYNAYVRARSGTACVTERFCIFVTPVGTVNVPPVITASANVSVDEGALLTVNITTTDANGDDVTLTATGLPTGAIFTPGTGGTGVITFTPTADQSGTYVVTITADDGEGGTTTATINVTVNDMPGSSVTAEAFTTVEGPLAYLNQDLCVHVEPVDASFDVSAVNLSNLTLSYNGTMITAESGSAQIDVDSDSDTVQEVQVCFTSAQLMELLGTLPPGESTIHLTLGGSLTTGETISASFDQQFILGASIAKGKGRMNVIARPNPFNPRTNLSFRISRAGRVRIDLFDTSGRLVRTVMAQTLAAGPHSVPWDGTNDRGSRVSSGAYFFRIQAPDGEQVQRVTVIK